MEFARRSGARMATTAAPRAAPPSEANTAVRRKGVARRLDELQATADRDPDAFDDRAREIVAGLAAMFAAHARHSRGRR